MSLANRRLFQVLVLLSQNRKYGVPREELAEAIWQDVPDERGRASLRQALALLRRAVGTDNLYCTLTTCRLASSFKLETDIDKPALRLSDQVSPELESHWIDQVLWEEPESTGNLVEPCVFTNFYQVVLITARIEPSRAIGLMKENLALTHGLSPTQMSSILRELGSCPLLPGWVAYFHGYVRNYQLNSRLSTPHFMEALESSGQKKDSALGVQSAVQIAFSMINQGQMGIAEKMAERSLKLANESRDKNLMGTAMQALASVKINLGQLEKAFELYDRAEQSYSSPVDSLLIRSIHVYYRSSVSVYKPLQSTSLKPKDFLTTSKGHSLTEWFSTAAPAIVAAPDSHPVDALAPLVKTLELAETMQNNHLTIFAMEALSRGYVRAGYMFEAQGLNQKSRQIRGAMAIKHSFWDLLAPVH